MRKYQHYVPSYRTKDAAIGFTWSLWAINVALLVIFALSAFSVLNISESVFNTFTCSYTVLLAIDLILLGIVGIFENKENTSISVDSKEEHPQSQAYGGTARDSLMGILWCLTLNIIVIIIAIFLESFHVTHIADRILVVYIICSFFQVTVAIIMLVLVSLVGKEARDLL
jgi:hypothetical protein